MNWQSVWDRRTLDRSRPLLEALMAADGLDTGFGNVSVESWRAFVQRIGTRLMLDDKSAIYEVGCGAGAFLYELDQLGCRVGGLDGSAALVGFAKEAMPHGDFICARAHELAVEPRVDFTLSMGVFLYFPDLAYARGVLHAMAAKSTKGIAVLDVPDKAREQQALTARRATLGPEEYAKKYAGLDHLYYERAWFADELHALGFSHMTIEDQSIDGYANGAFRFNVIATRG